MYKSKIGLGTVQFGLEYGISNHLGQTSPKEVYAILKLFRENGLDMIDTASGYGDSEMILGQNDISEFKIVSKFLPPSNDENIKNQFYQSVGLLNINKLYGFIAHRPLDIITHPEHWQELLELKEEGKVSKIGFSFNTTDEVEQILESGFIPDLVQVPFNYFDKRFLPYMNILKTMNCEIHTRSAFLQGLFFMPMQKVSPFFDFVKPMIIRLQEEFGSELPGILLKYCLKQENIDKVIIGVNNSYQFRENLLAINTFKALPQLYLDVPDNILTPSKWIL